MPTHGVRVWYGGHAGDLLLHFLDKSHFNLYLLCSCNLRIHMSENVLLYYYNSSVTHNEYLVGYDNEGMMIMYYLIILHVLLHHVSSNLYGWIHWIMFFCLHLWLLHLQIIRLDFKAQSCNNWVQFVKKNAYIQTLCWFGLAIINSLF
jgi:hypothetical protein